MSYSIVLTSHFKKSAKKLAKRYVSFKEDLLKLHTVLSENPYAGTSLGNNTYKLRLAVKSKGKGKSGGVRIIIYIIDQNREVYLIEIFDKSDMENVDDKDIKKLISGILQAN